MGDGTVKAAICGLVVILAIIAVSLRFYTRINTKAGLKADDWLILVGLLSAVAAGILLVWGSVVNPDEENAVQPGGSDRTAVLYSEGHRKYLKTAFAAAALYYTIVSTTKLSILLMYNRIFSISKSFRYQIIAASVLVVCFWISCTVATLTNCIPLGFSWNNGYADKDKCFNYNIFWMSSGIIEVAIDIIILTLPIRMIARLQLSIQKKFMLAGVFLLGAFVVVTGLVRAILGYIPGAYFPNYSRGEVWTVVHVGMAIVCACLPILKPLAIRVGKTGRTWYGWSRISSRGSKNRTIEHSGTSGTSGGHTANGYILGGLPSTSEKELLERQANVIRVERSFETTTTRRYDHGDFV